MWTDNETNVDFLGSSTSRPYQGGCFRSSNFACYGWCFRRMGKRKIKLNEDSPGYGLDPEKQELEERKKELEGVAVLILTAGSLRVTMTPKRRYSLNS